MKNEHKKWRWINKWTKRNSDGRNYVIKNISERAAEILVRQRQTITRAMTNTNGWWFVLSQQSQSIFITFVQCWTNVEDVGPALYQCYKNVLCLLGCPSDLSEQMWLSHERTDERTNKQTNKQMCTDTWSIRPVYSQVINWWAVVLLCTSLSQSFSSIINYLAWSGCLICQEHIIYVHLDLESLLKNVFFS